MRAGILSGQDESDVPPAASARTPTSHIAFLNHDDSSGGQTKSQILGMLEDINSLEISILSQHLHN
jgi:hypothetical protein